MKLPARRWMIAALVLGCAGTGAADAETWVPLQFRGALPIPYLVDVDSLQIDGSLRSLPGKWIQSAELETTGRWQFDCRARGWKAADTFIARRPGAPPQSVSTAQSWRPARAGSAIDRLFGLICSAPSEGAAGWLRLQLQSAVL